VCACVCVCVCACMRVCVHVCVCVCVHACVHVCACVHVRACTYALCAHVLINSVSLYLNRYIPSYAQQGPAASSSPPSSPTTIWAEGLIQHILFSQIASQQQQQQQQSLHPDAIGNSSSLSFSSTPPSQTLTTSIGPNVSTSVRHWMVFDGPLEGAWLHPIYSVSSFNFPFLFSLIGTLCLTPLAFG